MRPVLWQRPACRAPTPEHVQARLRTLSPACRREHGGGVPEFWGRESKYTSGTNFLGTPTDHFDVRASPLGSTCLQCCEVSSLSPAPGPELPC